MMMSQTQFSQLVRRLKKAYNTAEDTELMNELQDNGLVSDNAVTIIDVAEGDLEMALDYVLTRTRK